MKYCMKCGTLLEDSHERCIGCGSDVTAPNSWSLYPPELAKKIEVEKEENKSQRGLVIALIAVFLLLVAAVSVFVIFNAKKMKEEPKEPEKTVEEVVSDNTEEEEVEEVEEVEESASATTLSPLVIEEGEKKAEENDAEEVQEIRDSAGKYYSIGTVKDSAGNDMFTTIFPEDFSEKNVGINYSIYSSRYPESLTYVVGNEDGNVQFTYMSPQHFWYRKSDYKGQTRSYEYDIDNYMQFLTYSGAKGYIEALIKQSYTDIKGFKFIDQEEFSPETTAKIEEISNNHTKELLGEIGDYAKIGSDTVYAAMQAEYDASIYHYQATSRQGNTIYMDFYVPVIANTLGYVSEMNSDKGEVTEWLVPEFIAFETGNEELYNLYKDAFRIFVYNARLSDEFFYINHAYSEDIEKAVSIKREPVKLTSEKLKAYHSSFKPTAEINSFGKDVKEFLKTIPASSTSFTGNMNVTATSDAKVGFYCKEKNKVFISPSENEYPGSDYVSLEYHEGSSEAPSSEAEDSSSSSVE